MLGPAAGLLEDFVDVERSEVILVKRPHIERIVLMQVADPNRPSSATAKSQDFRWETPMAAASEEYTIPSLLPLSRYHQKRQRCQRPSAQTFLRRVLAAWLDRTLRIGTAPSECNPPMEVHQRMILGVPMECKAQSGLLGLDCVLPTGRLSPVDHFLEYCLELRGRGQLQ